MHSCRMESAGGNAAEATRAGRGGHAGGPRQPTGLCPAEPAAGTNQARHCSPGFWTVFAGGGRRRKPTSPKTRCRSVPGLAGRGATDTRVRSASRRHRALEALRGAPSGQGAATRVRANNAGSLCRRGGGPKTLASDLRAAPAAGPRCRQPRRRRPRAPRVAAATRACRAQCMLLMLDRAIPTWRMDPAHPVPAATSAHKPTSVSTDQRKRTRRAQKSAGLAKCWLRRNSCLARRPRGVR